MLSEAQLRSDIARVWDYVSVLKLGQSFSNPVSLGVSEAFKDCSRDPQKSYEEVYLTGLRNVDYNIILQDYSYFQFGREKDEEFRFAYYPNPILGSSDEKVSEILALQEFVEEGVIDSEEYLNYVSEIRVSRHPPMVRYEFSVLQYDAICHPCSHFHIGMYSDWRWGSAVSLTARFFCLTILRHLYPDAWFQSAGITSGLKVITFDEELAAIRTDCRILGDDKFIEDERHRLHFA